MSFIRQNCKRGEIYWVSTQKKGLQRFQKILVKPSSGGAIRPVQSQRQKLQFSKTDSRQVREKTGEAKRRGKVEERRKRSQ